MAKYRCTVCDYIYDESAGDNAHNIKKGTKFSDLPDDWVCPLCGVPKNMFEKTK
jgi:rubredoxin